MFDITQHDVAINGQGYRLGSYMKKEASAFVPRFNTGSESENHLDFWKEFSLNDWRGGAFQQTYGEKTKSTFIFGKPDQATGRLASVPDTSAIGAYTNSQKKVNYWAVFKGNIYFTADNNLGTSSTQNFWKLDASTNATSNPAGFPAALSTNNYTTDMLSFEDRLYFASKQQNVQSWDGTTWAVTNARMEKLSVFRDRMYGIAEDGGLHSLDGTTWTLLKRFGEKGAATNSPNTMQEFNGRLYIGKPEGLYAYDGVQVVRVIDFAKNQHRNNFKFMAAHSGWLYYTINNVIYRFNGATVEKIFQDDGLAIKAVLSAGEDLFVQASITSLYKYTGMADVNYLNVYVLRFDGVGFSIYAKGSADISTAEHFNLLYQNRKLYLEAGKTSTATNDQIVYVPVDREFYTPIHRLTWLSSEFTANLPEVQKYLHKLNVRFKKGGSGSITVDVQLRFVNKGGTVTLGATSSSADNIYNIFEDYLGGVSSNDYTDERFQIAIKASAAAGTELELEDVSLRYSINPAYRNKWSLNLLNYGTAAKPLSLKDGTSEQTTAAARRQNLYAARRQMQPIHFVDIDSTALDGELNISATTITCFNLDTLAPSGMVLIDDEKIAYTSRSTTQLLGCTRGYLGTTAAVHSANTAVCSLYLAQITQIVNERVIIDPSSLVAGKYISEIQLEIEEAT